MQQKEVAVCLRNHYPMVSPHATCTKITPLLYHNTLFQKCKGREEINFG